MKSLVADPLVKFRQPGRLGALLHRLSGLVLATFLPLHFLSLGLALNEPTFAAFIAWTEHPFVKVSETVLVAALAMHFSGGIRLLLVEFLGVAGRGGIWIAGVICFAVTVGILFLMNVFG